MKTKQTHTYFLLPLQAFSFSLPELIGNLNHTFQRSKDLIFHSLILGQNNMIFDCLGLVSVQAYVE